MKHCAVCNAPIKKGRLCDKSSCNNYTTNLMTSPRFFFENVLIVRYERGQPVYFHPSPWQIEVLEHIEHCVNHWRCECGTDNFIKSPTCSNCERESTYRPIPIRICIQKGRRIGFSILMSGIMIWFCTMRLRADGSSKSWDVISASHKQSKQLFAAAVDMVKFNDLLYNNIHIESNGKPAIGKNEMTFASGDATLKGIISALSSGGSTKRGRSPSGQVFDEAAYISDDDYNDLDISSASGDDHQIVGSTPRDNTGFFYNIMNPNRLEDDEAFTEFKTWVVPGVVLTEEGRGKVDRSRHYDLTEDDIERVNGYGMTKKRVLQRIRRQTFAVFKREVLGEFVAGSDLFYPWNLVEGCVDDSVQSMDLHHIPHSKEQPEVAQIRVGVDMAKTVDATAVICLAEFSDGHLETWHWDSWRKVDYVDQYERIVRICQAFVNKGYFVKPYVDSTGIQDANVDSIRRLFGTCVGVDFNIGSKQAMADKLYYLLSQQKITLPRDRELIDEVRTVTVNLKGTGGHLGDYAAALWCAISKVMIVMNDNVPERPQCAPSYGVVTSEKVNTVLADTRALSNQRPVHAHQLRW